MLGEDELLLVRSRSSPDFFHFPSGTVSPLEAANSAAQRELNEEASIVTSLKPTLIRYRFRYSAVLFHPRSIQEVFIGEVASEIQATVANEIVELRWCDIAEAKRLVYSDLGRVIDKVANARGYHN